MYADLTDSGWRYIREPSIRCHADHGEAPATEDEAAEVEWADLIGRVDEIEGSQVKIGRDGETVWLHTANQVRDWLRTMRGDHP